MIIADGVGRGYRSSDAPAGPVDIKPVVDKHNRPLFTIESYTDANVIRVVSPDGKLIAEGKHNSATDPKFVDIEWKEGPGFEGSGFRFWTSGNRNLGYSTGDSNTVVSIKPLVGDGKDIGVVLQKTEREPNQMPEKSSDMVTTIPGYDANSQTLHAPVDVRGNAPMHSISIPVNHTDHKRSSGGSSKAI